VKIVKTPRVSGRYNKLRADLRIFFKKSRRNAERSLTIVSMSVEACYQKGDTPVAKKKAKKAKAKKAARKKK